MRVLEEIERMSVEETRCEKQGIYFKWLKKRNLKRMKINRFLNYI